MGFGKIKSDDPGALAAPPYVERRSNLWTGAAIRARFFAQPVPIAWSNHLEEPAWHPDGVLCRFALGGRAGGIGTEFHETEQRAADIGRVGVPADRRHDH